ncbi:MAG: hypothetical protein Kow0092_09270 [Deferrisomatales bacterium]
MPAGTVRLEEILEGREQAVPVGSSLREVFEVMDALGRGVVVLVDGARAVGILTERDAVALLYAGADLDEEAARHARKPLVEARGDRTVGYALNLMIENGIRRLVVVDPEGAFRGVVTQKDLMRHLEEDFYRSALRVKHVREHFRALVASAPGETVRQVLGKMVENRISAVPVLEGQRAVGIITEKDIVKLARAPARLDDPVARHMSRPVVAVGWEAKLVDIVRLMNARDIRRVVIEGAGGAAEGVLTHRDLVRNLEGDYNEFLERKLRYTKDVLNLLPQMLLEVVDTGSEQLIVWANEKVLSAFGRTLLDKAVTALVPAEMWLPMYGDLLRNGKVEDVRFKKGAQVFEFSGFYLPIEKAGEKGRIQLILRDITEEFLLATTDPLTRIYNRRYMSEFLSKEAERCRRMGRTFSVVIVDVDDFKRVNDSYGHASGDRVLQAVVQRLQASTREYDIVGRYGGEEFVVIMPEIDREVAAGVADRVRRCLEREPVDLGGGLEVAVTASFGVAAYGRDGTSPEDLLVRADKRLYRAKREGKNRVVCDDPPGERAEGPGPRAAAG